MPRYDVKWEGLEQLAKKLKARPELVSRATESALFIEAEETMAEAKKETPVDEGVLRGSGHVQLPTRDGDRVSVELGFGGPAGTGNQGATNPEDVGYAVYVHEDLTAHHTVGKAKYLEDPLNRRRSGLPRRLARRIRAFVRRGGA